MTIQYKRLTLAEGEEISKGIWAHEKLTQIAYRLDRNSSTLTRDVKKQVKRKK